MSRYDAVIVGGGHNGLVAATLLARPESGRRARAAGHVGGAAVSGRVAGRRREALQVLVSRQPVSAGAPPAARAATELRAARSARIRPPAPTSTRCARGSAARVAPTLLEPLHSRDEFRRLLGEDAWLLEQPLSEELERAFDDDVRRGIELTDATIGTFAPADDP